ncbi:macro domain-containing protein [Tissierella sp.]|uniref:macro domain-containing protein n=1 Tax=Tissierella sp. TaxID=41274 RepID=UPI00285659B7|nr:macro domain-containing protein [Tissierella sp.]MDR7855477.1 macro domain-containing protein [Tissierella sp.]
MPLEIIRNDITKMSVDAIVNAANMELKIGGGVCGAIFSAAGAEKLQDECSSIGSCDVGQAVVTNGYDLAAKYIIHTVGPIWQGGNENEAHLLRSCYINSLKLGLKYKCKSIAFPLISSGIYSYPKDQALQIAVSTIGEFLLKHEMQVYLVVYDKNAIRLSEKLFTGIKRYIDDNYVEEHKSFNRSRELEQTVRYQLKRIEEKDLVYSEDFYMPTPEVKPQLKDVMAKLEESFSQMLLRIIDERGMTDVETYKRANIDRRLFSKIRSDKDYNPSKVTAISFAIALGLNLDETLDLLGKAGYTLSRSNKFDVIIEYFIEEENYNIHEINEALFAFDQITLGV